MVDKPTRALEQYLHLFVLYFFCMRIECETKSLENAKLRMQNNPRVRR